MKMSNSSGIKKLSELPAAGLRQPGEKSEAKAKAGMINYQPQAMLSPVKSGPANPEPDCGGAEAGMEFLRFNPESLVQGIVFQTVLGAPRCRKRGWR